MNNEETIKLIAGRIEDEFRKHPTLNWQEIAAKKIHSQWFEFYVDKIKSMEGQVKELREENEIQGNYNDMLIKELESLQKAIREEYDKDGTVSNLLHLLTK